MMAGDSERTSFVQTPNNKYLLLLQGVHTRKAALGCLTYGSPQVERVFRRLNSQATRNLRLPIRLSGCHAATQLSTLTHEVHSILKATYSTTTKVIYSSSFSPSRMVDTSCLPMDGSRADLRITIRRVPPSDITKPPGPMRSNCSCSI